MAAASDSEGIKNRMPSEQEMLADIAADQAAIKARYVASKRHTIQVDRAPILCRPSAATAAS